MSSSDRDRALSEKERKSAEVFMEMQKTKSDKKAKKKHADGAIKQKEKKRKREKENSSIVLEKVVDSDVADLEEISAKARKKLKKALRKEASTAAKDVEGELCVDKVHSSKKNSKNNCKTKDETNGPQSKTDTNAHNGALPITVSGMDVTPLTNFSDAQFPKNIEAYILDQNFCRPTPIQSYCWPVLNSGRDVIGIAETGSGKTLAFGLPGLTRILASPNQSKSYPRMLVLAPTRELAIQSSEVLELVGKRIGLSCVCLYGGVPKHAQKKMLQSGNGAQAIIATPGRLKDLCSENFVDLSHVSFLVLDEADRMLDMGFEQDVRDIIAQTNPKRQTAMFSATWPHEIRQLAAEFLKDPVRVTVGDDDLTANIRVEQHVEVISDRDRDARLMELLSKCHSSRDNRVLVFALYKKEAARLEALVTKKGYAAVAIHGDKGQVEREKALSAFRLKEVPLMIATDVAARGLDIPGVEYVINYSFPLETSSYIHRIGRTGRAGKSGISYTFFHSGDKARAGELINVLMEAGQVVPDALTKFGTHVKKKEHKLYGAFAKDIDTAKKATKITFDDSD